MAFYLEKYQKSLMMILEDFGGESLDKILKTQQLSLKVFLELAIRISDIVGQIHQQNIIHKDINPSNIVWNLKGSVSYDILTNWSWRLPRIYI